MLTLVAENWPFFLIALLIGMTIAYMLWGPSRNRRDVARLGHDEPAAPHSDDQAAAEKTTSDPVLAEPAGMAAAGAAALAAVPEKVVDAAVAPPPIAIPTPTPMPRQKPAPRPEIVERPEGKPNIAAAVGEPDNLRLIKGVGPKLNKLLIELGVTRFDQIAAWKEAEISEVDPYLGSFSGRITRDSWIDQAKYLAKDDIAGFEKKYGKL